MIKFNLKAEYHCEIIKGDNNPLFKVTSSEFPNNPIIRDSTTGCWIVICKRVNEINKEKKKKVTVSGNERFGLMD